MATAEETIAAAAALGDRVDGNPDQIETVVPQLVALLGTTSDVDALVAIIGALGQAWCPDAAVAVLPYADHKDRSVRLAVARALPGGASRTLKEDIAAALIRLSRDESSGVRDWATFGLASQLAVDSWDVRDALFERANDPDSDTRDEAIFGLARRHDARAFELIADRLEEDRVGRLAFEGAALLADERLVPPLARWLADLPEEVEVQRALDACLPERQQERVANLTELLQTVQNHLDAAAPGTTAWVSSERLSTEVWLGTSASDPVWSVPALLQRAGGSIQAAARAVVSDLGRTR